MIWVLIPPSSEIRFSSLDYSWYLSSSMNFHHYFCLVFPLSLSFFFFFDVLIWIHQSFALLLCLKLRVKHGSHPSCFSRELLFLTFCLAVAAWLIGSPKPLFELRWWVSCPIHKLCYNSRWLVPQKISSVEDKRETWPAAGMGPRSPNRASIAWGRQAQKKKNI